MGFWLYNVSHYEVFIGHAIYLKKIIIALLQSKHEHFKLWFLFIYTVNNSAHMFIEILFDANAYLISRLFDYADK